MLNSDKHIWSRDVMTHIIKMLVTLMLLWSLGAITYSDKNLTPYDQEQSSPLYSDTCDYRFPTYFPTQFHRDLLIVNVSHPFNSNSNNF